MNLRSSQFFDHFRNEMAHLRQCGWRQPIVMRGTGVMPVGAPDPRQTLVHDNDNQRGLA
jgi:hypothetical protein